MTNNTLSSLLEGFLHWEKIKPNDLYMVQPLADGSVIELTWGEVGYQARCMASYLKSLHLKKGTNIGILGKNSAHWIIADLAIWMSGHVSVPLFATLNADSTAFILDHSEVQFIFVGKLDGISDNWNELKSGIPEALPQIALPMAPITGFPTWDDTILDQVPMLEITLPGTEQLATIVYTSGSTGRPKGVMHSHRSMMSMNNNLKTIFGLNESDRFYSYLPLAHVGERAFVESVSLLNGCQVYFNDNLDTFSNDMMRAKPTIFFSVPRLWTKFYLSITKLLSKRQQLEILGDSEESIVLKKTALENLGLQHTRLALTGTAPLPEGIVKWYRSIGLEMIEAYGMSENMAVSHFSRPGSVRIGYVGPPSVGVEARISDIGELEVKSPGQMIGYFKDPDKTAKDMTVDGFFKTGDRGEIDEQQRLRITGRVKDLFKTSKGKYVAPVPIEQILGNHSKIEIVCVAGSGEPQPFALIVLSPAAQEIILSVEGKESIKLELLALLFEVNSCLEKHEKLNYFVVLKKPWSIENGFLTPTLKIRRNIIEDNYVKYAGEWLENGEPIIWY